MSIDEARAAVDEAVLMHYRTLYLKKPPHICGTTPDQCPTYNEALDALIAEVERSTKAAMPCYRVNWERETRELTCRALVNVRMNSSAPFKPTRLCPTCTARAKEKT